jgi:hypothetical protein
MTVASTTLCFLGFLHLSRHGLPPEFTLPHSPGHNLNAVADGKRLWKLGRDAMSPFGELCCAIFFERSLEQPVSRAANPLQASIRLADELDLDEICGLYAGDPWLWLGRGPDDPTARSLYVDRLARGESCYLAIVDGRIAHVNWTCFTWGDALPGHPIRLRPGEIYTTDALTPGPFRGKGLHALVLGTMLSDARAKGFRQAFTLGQLDRPDALKGLRTVGWRECGRVVYFLAHGATKTALMLRGGHVAPLFRD